MKTSGKPLIKSWMNSLSPELPIAALASTCNSRAIASTYRLALENSESQSASPRLNQRFPGKIILITLLFFSANSYAVEITPLFGYRTGGEFIDETTDKKHTLVSSESYGFIIGFPYEHGKTIEVYYSHQSSDLNSVSTIPPATPGTANLPLTIDYLHIGGTTPIYKDKNLKTFVSGGLGFTYLSPDFINTQSDLRASFSIGIGLKWPLTERIALRLETRGLATLFNSNAALFCNGGCSLSVNGSLLFQAEVFAGLAIRF